MFRENNYEMKPLLRAVSGALADGGLGAGRQVQHAPRVAVAQHAVGIMGMAQRAKFLESRVEVPA